MRTRERIQHILLRALILLIPIQLGKHFWPSFAYVRGLRIDYLAPTLFLTDLIVISLIAISAIRSQLPSNQHQHRRGRILVVALATLLILVNLVSSPVPPVSLYSWLRVLELALLFCYLRSLPPRTIDAATKLLLAPMLYSSLLALLQFAKQGTIGGLFYWLGERTFTLSTPGIAKAEIGGRIWLRPYATFPHPNALAGFLLISLLLLPSPKRSRSRLKRLLVTATMLAAAAALLLTASLSAWLAGALLLTLRIWNDAGRRLTPTMLLPGAALAVSLVVFPPESASLVYRLQQAQAALVLIQNQPLTGVGLGSSIPALQSLRLPLSAAPLLSLQPIHNIFLLLAAEVGLVGLLAFFWFVGVALRRAARDPTRNLTLALLGIILTGSLDHYWLTLHQNRLLMTLVLAIAWRMKAGSKNARRSQHSSED